MSQNFMNIRSGLNLGLIASDPSSPNTGDFYYNSTMNAFRYYNGTSWLTIGQGQSLGAPTPTISTASVTATTGGFVSGTYTTPANVAYIRVRMVGGGGGGGGSGTGGAGNGGTGGTSSFGSLLSCTGGAGGAFTGATGANGGSGSISNPAIGTTITGNGGGGYGYQITLNANYNVGGFGGVGMFGGGAAQGSGNEPGSAATANSGSGGNGGANGNTAGNYTGNGGGAGGGLEAIIPNPSSTYTYTVGAGGSSGSAGTSGYVGGAGGSGYIEVTEYYYNGVGAFAGAGGAYTPTVSTALNTGTATGTGGFVSGTYTTPANVLYIEVEAVGGGGGSSNVTTSGNNPGGNGGTTTFGPVSSTGGTGGGINGGNGQTSPGGVGSVTTSSSVIQVAALNGGDGSGANYDATLGTFLTGGAGGNSYYGGAGGTTGYSPGSAGYANTGSGGGGGGTDTTNGAWGGAGGGAGGFAKAIIYPTASQTFSYSVGAGGTAGGYAGGSGAIYVTEYYSNGAVGTATNVTGIVQPANGGTGSNTYAGNYYWSGYYPSSNTYYWINSTSGSFFDWTPSGTPPNPTALQTSNFPTVSKDSSGYPSASFTPTRSGTLEVSFQISEYFPPQGATSASYALNLVEGITSTILSGAAGYQNAPSVAPTSFAFEMTGYYTVTSGTAVDFRIQTQQSTSSTAQLGGVANFGIVITMAMKYIN